MTWMSLDAFAAAMRRDGLREELNRVEPNGWAKVAWPSGDPNRETSRW
jgi:hypothetical protein